MKCLIFSAAAGRSAAGRGAVVAEVFLTAVAQPDPQDLRDLFFLGGSETLVEGEGAGALEAAGTVAVGVPVRAGEADATCGFLHQSGSTEIVVTDFSLCRHGFERKTIHPFSRDGDGIMRWSNPAGLDRVGFMTRSCLLLTFFAMTVLPAMSEQAKPLSYYLIGNSLTQDTVPSKLDGDVQWHVDCGKSLPFLFENPAAPCVKNSTIWPEAFKVKQYDLISVQVHYGSTLEEDAAVLSEFLSMQPKAIFVIHSGWARSATRAEEYAEKSPAGKMTHRPVYLERLIEKLRSFHPGREIRQTHAQDLLARIADDIEAGKAPFSRIEDLYRDDIHLNVVTGRYLMHNAMRHALGQPRSVAGFEAIPSPVKAYLDGVLGTLPDAKASAE